MCLFNTRSKPPSRNPKEVKKRRRGQPQQKEKFKSKHRLAQSGDPPLSFAPDKEPSSPQVSEHLHQAMSSCCPVHDATMAEHPTSTVVEDVYIFPKSMMQVSFPIVDYSLERRVPGAAWPSYYMAITANCATPEDIVARLAPPGSGLTVVARLPDYNSSSLDYFRNASDIRRNSLQLEICETMNEHAPARGGEPAGHGGCSHKCDR